MYNNLKIFSLWLKQQDFEVHLIFQILIALFNLNLHIAIVDNTY
jgi:hypothetical protein